MSEREVSAKEILADLRSGLDSAALMEKYRLSERGLENLFRELEAAGLLNQFWNQASDPRCVRIRTAEIVADISSGMGSAELRKKYGLTPWGVQKALRKLVEARAIRPEDFCHELRLRYEAVCPDNVRETKRYYLDFEVNVCEEECPDIVGNVRDMSRRGLGLTGIEAQVDETKAFVLSPDGLNSGAEVRLQAKCLWVRRDETTGECLTGFEIAPLSRKDQQALTKLLRAVTFGD